MLEEDRVDLGSLLTNGKLLHRKVIRSESMQGVGSKRALVVKERTILALPGVDTYVSFSSDVPVQSIFVYLGQDEEGRHVVFADGEALPISSGAWFNMSLVGRCEGSSE